MFTRIAAREAIKFQHGSPFRTELRSIFSNILSLIGEKVDKYDDQLKTGNGLTRKGTGRIFDDIRSLWETDKYWKKVADCVQKHTGVIIDEFYLDDQALPNMGVWFLLQTGQKNVDLVVGGSRASGQGRAKEVGDQYLTYLKEISRISEEGFVRIQQGYNRDASKLVGDMSKVFKIEMYMTTAAIALPWMTPDVMEDGWDDCLASVVAHEVGHVFYYAEVLADRWRISRLTEDFKDRVKTTVVKENLLESLMATRDFTSRYKAMLGNTPDTTDPELLIRALNKSIKEVQTKSSPDDDDYVGGMALINIAVSLLTSAVSMRKLSDIGASDLDMTICERSADEFASRHGFSEANARFEIIMQRAIYRYYGVRYDVDKTKKTLSFMDKMSMLKCWIFVMDRSRHQITGSYDPVVVRIKENLKQLAAALQDPNLPSSAKKEYLSQYKEILDVVERYESLAAVKFRSATFTLIDRIANFGPRGFMTWAKQERRNNKEILDSLSDMTRSDLTYWSEVFKS